MGKQFIDPSSIRTAEVLEARPASWEEKKELSLGLGFQATGPNALLFAHTFWWEPISFVLLDHPLGRLSGCFCLSYATLGCIKIVCVCVYTRTNSGCARECDECLECVTRPHYCSVLFLGSLQTLPSNLRALSLISNTSGSAVATHW